MHEPLKRVIWHGDSLERVRLFPADACQDIGFEPGRVQRGLEPRDYKPMRAVGPGVMEIRVHAGSEYRVFYLTALRDAVHVLHAFVKKTRKIRQADIRLGASRYRDAVRGVQS